MVRPFDRKEQGHAVGRLAGVVQSRAESGLRGALCGTRALAARWVLGGGIAVEFLAYEDAMTPYHDDGREMSDSRRWEMMAWFLL